MVDKVDHRFISFAACLPCLLRGNWLKKGRKSAMEKINGEKHTLHMFFNYLTASVISVVSAAGTMARCLSLVVGCKLVGVVVVAISEEQRDRKHRIVCCRNTVRSTRVALLFVWFFVTNLSVLCVKDFIVRMSYKDMYTIFWTVDLLHCIVLFNSLLWQRLNKRILLLLIRYCYYYYYYHYHYPYHHYYKHTSWTSFRHDTLRGGDV